MNRLVRLVTQPLYHRKVYKIPDSRILLFQEQEQKQYDEVLSYTNFSSFFCHFPEDLYNSEEEEFEHFKLSLYAIYQ